MHCLIFLEYIVMLFFSANIGKFTNKTAACKDDGFAGGFSPVKVASVRYDDKNKTYSLKYSFDNSFIEVPKNIAVLLSKNNAIPEGVLVGNATLSSVGNVHAYSAVVDGTNEISGITPPADGYYCVYLAGYGCDFGEEMAAGRVTWRMASVNSEPLALHLADRNEYYIQSAAMDFADLKGTVIVLSYIGDDVKNIAVSDNLGNRVCFGGAGCYLPKLAASGAKGISAVLQDVRPNAIVAANDQLKHLKCLYIWIPGESWNVAKRLRVSIDGNDRSIVVPTFSAYDRIAQALSALDDKSSKLTRGDAIALQMVLMESGMVADGGEFCLRRIRDISEDIESCDLDRAADFVVKGNLSQDYRLGIKVAFSGKSDVTAFVDGYSRLDLACGTCSEFWKKKTGKQLRWSMNVDVYLRDADGSFKKIESDQELSREKYNAAVLNEKDIEQSRSNGLWVKGCTYVDRTYEYAMALLNGSANINDLFSVVITDLDNRGNASSDEIFVGYYNGGNVVKSPRIGMFKSGRAFLGFKDAPVHTLLSGNASLYAIYKDPFLQNLDFKNASIDGGGVKVIENKKYPGMLDFLFTGIVRENQNIPFEANLIYKENAQERYVVPFVYTARDRLKYEFYFDDHSIGGQLRAISKYHGAQSVLKGGYVERYNMSALPIGYENSSSGNDVAARILEWSNGVPNFVNLYSQGDKLTDGSDAIKSIAVDNISIVGFRNSNSSQVVGVGELIPSLDQNGKPKDWVIKRRRIDASSQDIDGIARNIIANRVAGSARPESVVWSSNFMESVDDLLSGVKNLNASRNLTSGIWGENGASANDDSPWDVGWEWLTGVGPRNRHFFGGDDFTELLRKHSNIIMKREEAVASLKQSCSECKGTPIGGKISYSLRGVKGVGLYLHDYSTLFTGGLTGNIAVTYLGSYVGNYSSLGIDCQRGEALVHFHVHNASTIESATHPPIIGYKQWWHDAVGEKLNNFFSKGVLSKTEQDFDWDEKLVVENSGCK